MNQFNDHTIDTKVGTFYAALFRCFRRISCCIALHAVTFSSSQLDGEMPCRDAVQLMHCCVFFYIKLAAAACGSTVYAISANVNGNAGYGSLPPYPSLLPPWLKRQWEMYIPRQLFATIIAVTCVRTWDISQKFSSFILHITLAISPYLKHTHTHTHT